MAWFYLCIAGLLEVGWAVGMKLSDGFKKPMIAAPTVVGIWGTIDNTYLKKLSDQTVCTEARSCPCGNRSSLCR